MNRTEQKDAMKETVPLFPDVTVSDGDMRKRTPEVRRILHADETETVMYGTYLPGKEKGWWWVRPRGRQAPAATFMGATVEDVRQNVTS